MEDDYREGMYTYQLANLQLWRRCSHSRWQNAFRMRRLNVRQKQKQTCTCSIDNNRLAGACGLAPDRGLPVMASTRTCHNHQDTGRLSAWFPDRPQRRGSKGIRTIAEET